MEAGPYSLRMIDGKGELSLLKFGWFTMLATVLLANSISAAGLKLTTDQDKYWRYEMVGITAGPGQTGTAWAAQLPEKMSASIWQGKRRVVTIGKQKSVLLRREEGDKWLGNWPIPFNPVLGKYTVKLSAWPADGTTLTASANFKIRGREPRSLLPGFSVVTYEGGKKGPNTSPGLTPEVPSSWRNLVHWADFMGADAFWHCIGQTQVWARLKPEQFPWSAFTVRLMERVGRAVNEAGMKYGAWITAFVVIGDKPEATGYTYTWGWDRKNKTLRRLRYVSLGCEKRIQDIVELLRKFEASPVVDYLGLDYMRTDVGGYEFAGDFVQDMALETPAEWGQWSADERSLWMARLIEVERDAVAREQWQWWRAHKVALVLAGIVQAVRPEKPLWVFSLGWKTGHQHGQDMLMMLDAGVGFNAPMFYSINKGDLPHMLNSWKNYLRRSPASVVIGQCVDWNLLGRTKDPGGPEEHYIRQIQTMDKLMPRAKHFGFFWHDMGRAYFGARGPYGTMEWAMAGAASFSSLKVVNGRISYNMELNAPVEIIRSRETQIQVEITNATANTLTSVAVELVSLPRLTRLDTEPRVISQLAPGSAGQSVKLRFRTDQIYARNGGRQMVAVKAVCAEDGDQNPYFKFVYLPITAELGPPVPVVTPTDIIADKHKLVP